MPSSLQPAQRFLALDSWRGICALLVAAHHIEVHSALYWQPLIRNAWLFVDFFFVLSGFVIAHAYGQRIGRAAGETRSFVIRRFGRLWPLHVTMLLAMVALEVVRIFTQHYIPAADARLPFTQDHSVGAIVTNLFLVQALGFHDFETWNGPAWSISVEFYTYLVFAAVTTLVWGRIARLFAYVVIAIASVFVLLKFSDHGMRETFHWPIFRCFYGFFLGVLAYQSWGQQNPTAPRGTFAELFALAAIVIFLTVAPGHRAWEYLATPLFAFAIFIFAQESGAISRALTTRVPLALGRWSYSIYMVHTLVLSLLFSGVHTLDVLQHTSFMLHHNGGAIIELGSEWADDLLILAFLGVVIGFASLTYRWIERPGQRFFNRWAGPKAVEIPAQTA